MIEGMNDYTEPWAIPTLIIKQGAMTDAILQVYWSKHNGPDAMVQTQWPSS